MKLKKIIKSTEKIRYKIVFFFIKKLTPVFSKRVELISFKFCSLIVFKSEITNVPRPTTKFLKRFFGNNAIKGAEIGVQRGVNAKNILKELNVEKLFLVDSWENDNNFEIALERFKGNERVCIIKETSKDALKNIEDYSLDFVYIDADHSYDAVYQDIINWTKKVKSRGVVGGHDANRISVLQAVIDICIKNHIKFEVELPDWYFVKSNLGNLIN